MTRVHISASMVAKYHYNFRNLKFTLMKLSGTTFLSTLIITTRHYLKAEVTQCHDDCRSPILSRPVGPTRPWDDYDDLGNLLSLTKPYPYSIASDEASILKFNITMNIHNSPFCHSVPTLSLMELKNFILVESKTYATRIKTMIFQNVESCQVEVVDYPEIDSEKNETCIEKIQTYTAEIQVNANQNGFNYSTANQFYTQELKPMIIDVTENGLYNKLTFDNDLRIHQRLNRTFIVPGMSSNEVISVRSVGSPNPFTPFCEVGCSLFYSIPNHEGVKLHNCTDKCDDLYKYNVSVGYSDLAEVARLECRDGCQMAMKRCQPGFFCTQVRKIDRRVDLNKTQNESKHYEEGYMNHCVAGTYRDVDYSAVEKCILCPPGSFREDIKGRNLDSCSKCPVGTYNKRNGSTSILDCLRCPAGTFTNQPGSETCICITPASCSDNQLSSPADAEKKDTIPYIGRW